MPRGFQPTHGKSRSPTFFSYNNMMNRCHNPNCKDYTTYGAAGITVCDRWRNNFPQFLADMGEKPGIGYSIERIDNTKGYSPENCRWASSREQARNKSVTRLIEYRGETRCIKDWAEILDVPYTTLKSRLNRGYSMDEAQFKGDIRNLKKTK